MRKVELPHPVGRNALKIKSKEFTSPENVLSLKDRPAQPPKFTSANTFGIWVREYVNRYGFSDDPNSDDPVYDRDGYRSSQPDKGA